MDRKDQQDVIHSLPDCVDKIAGEAQERGVVRPGAAALISRQGGTT
jgi:hypothetical protein